MHRSAPALAALALAAAACGPSAAARRAQSLYDRGDYQGAARSADGDLAAAPGDAGLHRVAIRAKLAAGDARAAVTDYATWRAGKGDDLTTLRLLAETTLDQALRSPSVSVKVQAIDAIADLEIEALADSVIQRLGDQNDQVLAAASAAVLRAHPQAPDILAQMLTSDDPVARAIAVRGMADKVGEHAADDLRNATRDPDARVRRAAVQGLAPIVDAPTTAVLVHLAAEDADGDVRAAALRALSRKGRGDQREAGRRALGDAYLGARVAAIDLLAASGDTASVDAALGSPDPIVAMHAARWAKERNPAGAAAAIDRGLAATEWTVRAGALNLATAALGKGPAADRAARALADPQVAVRLAAARVLAAAGRQTEAITAFAGALTADPDDRIQAAADLARLGDARGVAALADLAQHADTPARRRAAVAAHLTARRITPGLVDALADPAPDVRVEAARVLWSLASNQLRAEG